MYARRVSTLQPILDEDERNFVSQALGEWGGSARATDALALMMGFRDKRDLMDETSRLATRVRSDAPLAFDEWRRALLATEIAFASDVVGSGLDWETVSGLSDGRSIALLRSVQRKVLRAIAGGE